MSENAQLNGLCDRFRGFYPVVIDVETAGFNAKTDALLEIAAITLKMDEHGWLMPDETLHFHVEPFEGANLQPEALALTGLTRMTRSGAVSEYDALHAIFKMVRKGMKESDCSRAIMVAHNATFDHSFTMTAAERAGLKRNPFHPFVTFDTAALSGLALGRTVLSKACIAAGMPFDGAQAHSALYDTEQTAQLFCEIVNRWKRLGGWPLPVATRSDKKATSREVAFFTDGELLRFWLVGMVLCRRLFDQLLQFTALVHFDDDIAAAHQFTVYPQLRESRPVGVFRQLGADIRVLQNINVSKTFATGGQRLTARAEETAAWQLRRPFHVQQDRVFSDLALDLF